MHNVIEIEALSKKYDLYKKNWYVLLNALPKTIKKLFFNNLSHEMWIFKNLDLTIQKGDRIAIVGENGTGKSTLLKIISHYIQPSSGKVIVHGKVHSLLNMGAGFYHNLNAYENIEAYFALYNVSVSKEVINDIIDFSELDSYAYQPLKTYSSGMFARFAFAVMTAIKPDILIIDEILGAGDAYFMGKCVERLNSLCNQNGMTLLLVSHDMQSAQKLCDKALWLHKGEIRSRGESLDVIKDYLAHIRHKDNIRLMSKDKKIPKDYLSNQSNAEHIVFRFVSDKSEENKEKDVKIYSIEAKMGHFPIDGVKVGKVFDNDLHQNIYIIESKNKTDWQSSQKDGDGYYRSCIDLKSEYRHAPFVVKLPLSLRDFHSEICISISYKSTMNCRLEIYSDECKEYKPLETIIDSKNELKNINISFDLNQLKNNEKIEIIETNNKEADIFKPIEIPEEFQLILNEKDQYGSKEILIENVQILDEIFKEVRVLDVGRPYFFRVYFNTNHTIKNPIFVFCIYTPDGLCVSQLIEQGQKIGLSMINNQKGYVDFYVPKLMLGAKDYVASVAIFKKMNESKLEPESYHVLDRCIYFKVEDSQYVYERGICIQPFIAKATI